MKKDNQQRKNKYQRHNMLISHKHSWAPPPSVHFVNPLFWVKMLYLLLMMLALQWRWPGEEGGSVRSTAVNQTKHQSCDHHLLPHPLRSPQIPNWQTFLAHLEGKQVKSNIDDCCYMLKKLEKAKRLRTDKTILQSFWTLSYLQFINL